MNNRTYPVCYILPPHMLKEISQRGTTLQKQLALKTLSASEQFRSLRQLFADVTALAAPVAATQKQRIIYNVGNTSNLPGQSVRTEGTPPTGDSCVDEAYDGSGATYDLFKDVYSRNSMTTRVCGWTPPFTMT